MKNLILKSLSLILLSFSIVGCWGSSSDETKPKYEGYYKFDWNGRTMTLHLFDEENDGIRQEGIFELSGYTGVGTIRGTYWAGSDGILECTPDDLSIRHIYINVKRDKAGSESGYLWWFDYSNPAESYNLSHENCYEYTYSKHL